MSLFWRILFAENPDSSNIQSVNSEEDDPFSMDFSHSMAIFHWVAYQVIMSILMLNILIAIMNTTYAEVWQNKDVMWKNQKTYYEVRVSKLSDKWYNNNDKFRSSISHITSSGKRPNEMLSKHSGKRYNNKFR